METSDDERFNSFGDDVTAAERAARQRQSTDRVHKPTQEKQKDKTC